MNWDLKLQYSANFNYTIDSFFCNYEKQELIPLAYAIAPDEVSTTLTIVGDFPPELNISTPFYLYGWNRQAQERVFN